MFVEPKVLLLASTYIEPGAAIMREYEVGVWTPVICGMDVDDDATAAESLIEVAGRACYQSFHKPNPATHKNEDYLRRTLFEQKHWSIAEHASATLYFTGVSRAFTHELIRHRHLSYSQLSQRFVDESEAKFVLPPAIEHDSDAMHDYAQQCVNALGVYINTVDELQAEGKTRKQAREASRALLPNGIETRIVVTGNLRAWHEVIQRRTAPDADAEMQKVMAMARHQLAKVSPVIFGGDDD